MTLPSPLVTPEVDLRDFAFMPLDTVRLRDSDLAAIATGDGFRAAVLLWCAAWHQSPAASVPTDDRALARLAGYGRDITGWLEVKEDALRGFIECDDGRLYHPVIAEKAIEAWAKKQSYRDRAKRGNEARWNSESNPKAIAKGSDSDSVSELPSDPKGQGQCKGEGEEEKKEKEENARERAPLPIKEFETQFWPAFPNRVGKDAARRAWRSAVKRAPVSEIMAGLRRYAAKTDDRPWCNPATFLNQGRWADEPSVPGASAPNVLPFGHDPPKKTFTEDENAAAAKRWNDYLASQAQGQA